MKQTSGNGTNWNPYSWTDRANVFFLDQPYVIRHCNLDICSHKAPSISVGVGFSYADFGRTVETTEDAAKDIYAFVSIFFQTFESFQGRAFHLSGESYGVCSPQLL